MVSKNISQLKHVIHETTEDGFISPHASFFDWANSKINNDGVACINSKGVDYRFEIARDIVGDDGSDKQDQVFLVQTSDNDAFYILVDVYYSEFDGRDYTFSDTNFIEVIPVYTDNGDDFLSEIALRQEGVSFRDTGVRNLKIPSF